MYLDFDTFFQAILKGLVMWIVSTSAAAQRVRANLYGALLNYLRIGKVSKGPLPRNSDEEKLKKANLEVLLGKILKFDYFDIRLSCAVEFSLINKLPKFSIDC